MSRLDEPRLTPLTIDEVDGETQELLRQGADAMGGRILNIFGTLARHPQLYKRWARFGNQILFRSTLSGRDREIAILRIGWLCAAEYEWGQHVIIGRREGLSDEEIRRIADGPDADGWTLLEAAILRATDELHDDAFISDATWAQLAAELSEKQCIELVFTVGQYNLVSMALNTLGVQRDEDVPGFVETAGRKPPRLQDATS
ncbi:MAG: carboxymuconolactone decarboxylase family protein [Acidobacteriota bacterium]